MTTHFKTPELFSTDRKEGSGQNHQLDQGEKISDHRLNNKKELAKHE